MLAIKYRADFSTWPEKIRLNVETLPEGFDALLTQAQYDQLIADNTAAYEAFKVSQAQAAALGAAASKFAAVRAKWQNMADRYASENSAGGITTATAVTIADSFSTVEKYLRLNVPTKAILELDNISPIEPFLTQAKINSMKAELLAFIQETFNL